MSYFYLVASLPMLELGDTPPYTADEYVFHCTGALSSEDLTELEHIVAGESEECSSSFAEQWFGADTQLRNAVSRARRAKRGGDAKGSARSHVGFHAVIERAVSDAFSKQSPLDREFALDQCRWEILDDLSLQDPFGLSTALAFGVKLQLASRWAAMSEDEGFKNVEALIDKNVARQESGEAAAV